MTTESPRLLDYLRSKYSTKHIKRAHPWAHNIRAGVVLIHNHHVLMVQQIAYGNNRANFGFPKGGIEQCDTSPIDAAMRELAEETGIDVLDPALDARFSSIVLAAVKPNREDELHLYFIASLAAEPEIVLNHRELMGFSWVDLAGIAAISPVSHATAMVLRGLYRINLDSVCNIYTSWQQMFCDGL